MFKPDAPDQAYAKPEMARVPAQPAPHP